LAAALFSKNNKSGSRSKHIDIKYIVVRERIKEQEVSIEYTSTNFMIADLMTKELSIKTFSKYVERMGLVSSFYA
jgi:hypothetical protein